MVWPSPGPRPGLPLLFSGLEVKLRPWADWTPRGQWGGQEEVEWQAGHLFFQSLFSQRIWSCPVQEAQWP